MTVQAHLDRAGWLKLLYTSTAINFLLSYAMVPF